MLEMVNKSFHLIPRRPSASLQLHPPPQNVLYRNVKHSYKYPMQAQIISEDGATVTNLPCAETSSQSEQ